MKVSPVAKVVGLAVIFAVIIYAAAGSIFGVGHLATLITIGLCIPVGYFLSKKGSK